MKQTERINGKKIATLLTFGLGRLVLSVLVATIP